MTHLFEHQKWINFYELVKLFLPSIIMYKEGLGCPSEICLLNVNFSAITLRSFKVSLFIISIYIMNKIIDTLNHPIHLLLQVYYYNKYNA